jgi:hypothetical protein
MRGIVPKSAIATLMLLAATACGGGSDTTAPPNADAVVGVYALSTINGGVLPQVVDQNGNDTAEVTQGVVTLKVDKTFTDVIHLRLTVSGNVTTVADSTVGSWTRQGNTVTLNAVGFVPYQMTWNGSDRLTQLLDILTLEYVK